MINKEVSEYGAELHDLTSTSIHKKMDDRWVRVIVYGLAVTLTSCLFAGWQQYSLILLKGGMYGWLCSENTTSENKEIPGLLTCPEQEREVNSLLPLASGMELAGAVVAGVILDSVGPRLCAVLGSLVGFGSYVLLIYSSATLDMLKVTMILTGIAINLIGFPALTLEDYFPKAVATTAAYIIACQCLSSVVPPILWLIWQTHRELSFEQLWWGYLLIIWIPVSVPYISLLPLKRKRKEIAQTSKFDKHELWSNLTSLPYIVMNLLSVVLMLQTSYWQLIMRSELGLKVSEFLGYTMPTQAIWALIIGRVTDRTKTPFIIAVLLVMYSVVYFTLPIGRSFIQYLSVIIFNVAMSYAYTVKYTYVQERFPQQYYGILVGLSGAIGGCGVFATKALNGMNSPVRISLILGSCSFVAMPLVWWLYWESKTHTIMSSNLTNSMVATKTVDSGVFDVDLYSELYESPSWLESTADEDFAAKTIRILSSLA